jgi:hypothetical protein
MSALRLVSKDAFRPDLGETRVTKGGFFSVLETTEDTRSNLVSCNDARGTLAGARLFRLGGEENR